ncbi:XdhC family protein [Flavobacteriaceae bacterium S356]|uniref:XdhC family protein n=1 Tax=Asprobacillus argus TaxID=3076534 RepID=A0ABU3LCS9_9FLAO|nr:XdhC family protein [Flavobacteriaceae bacterium S356]
MIHELKNIIHAAKLAKTNHSKIVFVSVVSLDGSSYRRPGVRMAILEDGTMIGAVSGGCVEKEILRQAQSVFKDELPKLMVYDGRYRLGCEGILYILIEPFAPSNDFFEAFEKQWKSRKEFQIQTTFSKEEAHRLKGGSTFTFSHNSYLLSPNVDAYNTLDTFHQNIKAGFQLLIVGSEHDAVELCKYASQTGWEVTIIAPPDDPKSIGNFPGASRYLGVDEIAFAQEEMDDQTAVVLMTHSFVKDLKYLGSIRNKKPRYLGLLGPSRRRDKMINELFEYYPDIDEDFIESIHGPAGINIGAETPQEIAISIMGEILTVVRNQELMLLKDKTKGIHQ